jgi:hypothetical protein
VDDVDKGEKKGKGDGQSDESDSENSKVGR